MTDLLKDISQITIYIKDEAQRVNEVALFQPLHKKSSFNEESRPLTQRKWTYMSKLSFFKRAALKVQQFLFRFVPFLVPPERETKEAKFKTVLALLLSQDALSEFFLGHKKQRETFFKAIQRAAAAIGYELNLPDDDNPIKISRSLTLIDGKKRSLIDDPIELNLQIASLNYFERNELLFRILNQVDRPPIQSVLEVTSGDLIKDVALTTKYAKYKIQERELSLGKFTYFYKEDQATSSIITLENVKLDQEGVMNQRIVSDKEDNFIGAYCGELSTANHVLEQILFILGQKDYEGWLENEKKEPYIEKKIFFTSLYSWNELGLIKQQKEAISYLNHKILKTKNGNIKLDLHHFNIPFNALNKFPSPAEIGASIHDLNDEALIYMTSDFLKKRGLISHELDKIMLALNSSRDLSFLKKQDLLLKEIDHFRYLLPKLTEELQALEKDPYVTSLNFLLSGKKEDGKTLRGIDKLIYLNILTDYLGYFHTKNCRNSTDRSAGANASDKAQHAFKSYLGHFFLPGLSDDEETNLFKVLYSMYLVFEEPEITTALSTGFLGEKFYNNFFQRNPETTKYLTDWLKKHPEMYLGLANFRS